ncbi:MAG: hypothetical protein L0G99_10450, partial [Propionibacteriales bacterium]|nr:hypothetical protein [Propionibacteriales bacterium]
MSTSDPTRDGFTLDQGVWHVIAGDPTPDELAAVAAVLTAVAQRSSSTSPTRTPGGAPRDGWIAHWRRSTAQVQAPEAWRSLPAPDAWRS